MGTVTIVGDKHSGGREGMLLLERFIISNVPAALTPCSKATIATEYYVWRADV